MQQTVNPYHFVTNCISGKWKMTILHHIHHYGKIRSNETKKTLGVSEKVLSQQLKELTHDGLVQRIQYNTIPLKVEYILTPLGEDLIPALDILYIWSIRRLTDLNLPIDPECIQSTHGTQVSRSVGKRYHGDLTRKNILLLRSRVKYGIQKKLLSQLFLY